MKRVLILTRDLPPGRVGGVASWVDDEARTLVTHGLDVTVLVERRNLASATDRPYRVQGVAGRSWQRWQGTWMGAAAWPAREDGTVVLGATWRLVTGVARVAPKAVILAGAHGSDLTRIGADRDRFRKLARRVQLVAVSDFLAGHARALGAPAAHVHKAPWPLSSAVEQVRGEHLVVVARLVPGKGLYDAMVLAQRLERRLVVVGEGPEQARAAAWARREGVAVDWRGAVPRKSARAVLGSAAAVLLLSEPGSMEGLGLTALEAAAAGVPAIGRDVGGVREAVGPGVLVPADATVATMDLTSVRHLLADPEAGPRARAHLWAHHGPAAFLERFEAIVAEARRS